MPGEGTGFPSACIPAPGLQCALPLLVDSEFGTPPRFGAPGLSKQRGWLSEGGKLEGARRSMPPGCLPSRPQFLPEGGPDEPREESCPRERLRDSGHISLWRWHEVLALQREQSYSDEERDLGRRHSLCKGLGEGEHTLWVEKLRLREDSHSEIPWAFSMPHPLPPPPASARTAGS